MASPRFPQPHALPGTRRQARKGPSLARVAVAGFGRITAAFGPFAGKKAAQRMQRLFTDTHLSVYRRSGGRVMGWFDTAPILLLTTEGRRSKRLRTVPVMYVPGEYPALVASNGGARQHPQWYRNLKANPQATIQIGAEAFVVWAEDAAGSERDALWARAVECYPAYARYQRNTSRVIPVVALRPSRR